MADDERPTNGGGFDDWLEEEPGPDTDPYAALSADEEAEAEIAEWMAFTGGSDDQSGDAAPTEQPAPSPEPIGRHPEPEPDVDGDHAPDAGEAPDAPGAPADADVPETDEPTEELILTASPGTASPGAAAEDDVAVPDAAAGEPADEDEEPPAPFEPAMLEPATSVEVAEFDGGGRPDTEELPIIAGAEVSAVPNDMAAADAAPDDAAEDAAEHDTGEMPVVEDDIDDSDDIDDTGELDPVPDASPPVFDLDEEGVIEASDRPFDISRDDYLATATREHAGLAAAIAEAETEETEQVALAAPIPGLETTVVGFEDVVEAEGHTKVRARASGDLLARVVTGVILIAAVGVSLFYRPALVALATVVFVIGAGEFYTALRRSGRQPIALFGFLGILGASLGAFVWGAVAIPVSFLLVATLLLLFYAVVPGKPEPMANLALTVTVMVWAGLGAYAMMIIDSEDFRPLVIGVVLTVALMDIAQYFVGRGLGRHQLSPWVSPKKTIEGLVGGVIVAFTLGALLHFVPPFELTSGLAIGAAVAVLSPLGDLAMSAAKRALGIKDMGSILPGHGGFLDRIDGLLFVIPAAWAIFVWAGLI